MVWYMLAGAQKRIEAFVADEAGNVTVEWVAVVAGAVAFAIVALTSISGGVDELAVAMGDELDTRPISTY